MTLQCLFFVLATVLHVLAVHGYIPAQPSNATVQGAGLNASRLHLQWYSNGSDWEYVTHQSVGEPSNGMGQGIFVHFSEEYAGNETTTTPWIAFVSCDANSTSASPEADIFTMAKDRGAHSAVLYSLYSETCVINPEYLELANRNQGLDVFTTQALDASWHIEYEFGQFGPSSETCYGYYNATMLNDAAGVINNTISLNYPVAPGFLFATLQAYDASGAGATDSGLQNDVNGTSTGTGDSSQTTGLAMIVLYAITGCVSALFCVVILSGAIKAIRHPRRYGPRLADPTLGGGQSRARGLGRAILDTFPIVKFGPSGNDGESSLPCPKDIESAPVKTESSAPAPLPNSVELEETRSTEERDEDHRDALEGKVASAAGYEAGEDNQASAGTAPVDLPPFARPRIITADEGTSHASPRERDTRMPECIGLETCPICIVDFEEGDDLRVLPCEGKHRFHQSCVDPWLLELSGSCPICRQEFHVLETIISGESESEVSLANHYQASTSTSHGPLSRYLSFARGRQRRLGSRYHGPPPPSDSSL